MGGFGYDWTGSSFLASAALQRGEAQLSAAEARLAGIRSFLADVEPGARRVFPTAVVGWRSNASERFVERLHGVRWQVEMMLAQVGEAERSAHSDVNTGRQHCGELGRQLAQAEQAEAERAEQERRIEQEQREEQQERWLEAERAGGSWGGRWR